jgi:glycosyltransferase involved in cell wall biosynthesis
MQLTVALCTYNPSRELVLRSLDAIVDQLETALDTEILVIDNNSSPSLAERGYLRDYPVRIIEEPRQGLTAARETAIQQARGDVIVFVDDDNILGENYLATVAKEFLADLELGLLGGRVVPEYAIAPPKWFAEFEPWLAIRRYPPGSRIELSRLPSVEPLTKNFPVGAGFAVRRTLALQHQQDCAETMRIEGRQGNVLSSGEDFDLGFFVLSRGKKIAVTGAISLIHVIPAGRVSAAYLQRIAAGNVSSAYELEKKWSERFGRPVYSMFSMSLASLSPKIAVSGVLGLCLPRYRIKRRAYTALARKRFGAA